ncbi:uncharacterized protein N7473_008784 [Penicillium subrubescens]|uniref:uncharacterized protein n=1 Tax=Penicillium subrubescens TaxID=1316194 RepID=UPI002544DBAB|nr:uncharacterized protein N7473_008784 [Penicillium subrubescens]KAJ5886110.1 hypothetical protein N7473_008784 [Penicillium subrubescens]
MVPMLATSRNRGLSSDICYKYLIKVRPMNEVEAGDLLRKKLVISAELEDMEKPVKTLDFIPLAIVLAAAYITHRSPFCSLSQYLNKIEHSDQEAAKILNHEAGLLCRDWEAKNSVLMTWQISFGYIRRVEPSAADLLSLMHFFDRQGIPHPENFGVTTPIADTEYRLDSDIITLRDFSLISVGRDPAFLAMHRLVQLTVRAWLKNRDQLERWKDQLLKEMKIGKRANTSFPMSNKFGQDHLDTLVAMDNLAKTYMKQERWEEASQLIEQVMMALDHDNPFKLSSFANLAWSLWNLGRHEAAEQLELQVMETRMTKLGADHPNMMASKTILSSLWEATGRHFEAIAFLRDCVAKQKKVFGPDYPRTLSRSMKLLEWGMKGLTLADRSIYPLCHCSSLGGLEFSGFLQASSPNVCVIGPLCKKYLTVHC